MQRTSRTLLNEFHNRVFCLDAASKSAVQYTEKYWLHLLNYVQDGRVEISNAQAERSIKPFVMGRKNFLIANVPKAKRPVL